MATAPLPGAEEHQDAVDAAKQVLILKIKGTEYRLAINNIPIQEKLVVRKATGLPFEAYIGDQLFGEDSVVILYWLACRGAGETFLTWTQACDRWAAMAVGPDDFEVLSDDGDEGIADGDEAFPESSGPV